METQLIALLSVAATIIGILFAALVALFVRRNGADSTEDDSAQKLLKLFLENLSRITVALERFAVTDQRLLDGHNRLLDEIKRLFDELHKLAEGQDDLVRIHAIMEDRRGNLRSKVDEGESDH